QVLSQQREVLVLEILQTLVVARNTLKVVRHELVEPIGLAAEKPKDILQENAGINEGSVVLEIHPLDAAFVKPGLGPSEHLQFMSFNIHFHQVNLRDASVS